ncbi:MAG TPA: hypothetical protein DEB17_09755 [Chlorobaculum sp.]|uniref:Uncharacterized protein n=1 Tax=Chlorobaculum tepidum (strain ATCC 49652 / DSM 12025 / NBRC 103806 / TLS) TaxID=194439 RepID=Q8KA86_CHLTE|nr:hypothetical protein CT2282 [Chlorobaculum tepidum TLS]HBU24252.1 hypothetical protein [Chlorobaculum sp.]
MSQNLTASVFVCQSVVHFFINKLRVLWLFDQAISLFWLAKASL